MNGEDRYRPGAHLSVLVLTDLNGCQVGCHRFGLLVDPRRLTRTGLLADQLAVGEGIERGIGGDRDSVRRFGNRMVVAREPGRRAVGLTCDQSSFVEFLPADFAPQALDRLGVAAVRDGDRQGTARGDLGRRREDQLVVQVRVLGAAGTVDGHLGHLQVLCEVEAELGSALGGDSGDDSFAGETVAEDLYVSSSSYRDTRYPRLPLSGRYGSIGSSSIRFGFTTPPTVQSDCPASGWRAERCHLASPEMQALPSLPRRCRLRVARHNAVPALLLLPR